MKKLIIVALLAIGASFAIGHSVGQSAKKPQTAVCHAMSEDSFPFDCDYRNGAWYPKTDK